MPKTGLFRCEAAVAACLATVLAAGAAAGEGRAVWVDGRAEANGADGSPRRPFATIASALKAARPGDVVSVRSGVYREALKMPSGEPNRPIVLRAEAGQRVVLSGGRRVEGWKRWNGGVWVASLAQRPAAFFADLRPRALARLPAEGWWVAESATGTSITDSRNLGALKGDPSGCEALVWTQVSYGTYLANVKAFDREGGTVTIINPEGRMRLYAGDRYCLRGCPDLLGAGEWGFREANGATDLYYRPVQEKELQTAEVPALREPLLELDGAHDVVVEGLEIAMGDGGALRLVQSHGVAVRRCILRHNRGGGLGVRDSNDVEIRGNLFLGQRGGIGIADSRGVIVEENEIHNQETGINLSGRCRDVLVRRNLLRGDYSGRDLPDGMGLSGDLTGVRLIENLCLLQSNGLLARNAVGVEIRGNVFVGAGSSLLSLDERTRDFQIRGNTMALAGYAAVALGGHGHAFFGNVCDSGYPCPAYRTAEANAFSSDRNLFWDSAMARSPFVSSGGGQATLEGFQQATGQDKNSRYGDPIFRGAPAFVRWLDGGRLHECTRAKWYLRDGTAGFLAGDRVEAGLDGLLHRIVWADKESVVVEPGLDAAPQRSPMVANWRTAAEAILDLRLGEGSPGLSLGEGGKAVGAQLDVQAYLRGDFNGDGRRDVPELPPEPATRPARE